MTSDGLSKNKKAFRFCRNCGEEKLCSKRPCTKKFHGLTCGGKMIICAENRNVKKLGEF